MFIFLTIKKYFFYASHTVVYNPTVCLNFELNIFNSHVFFSVVLFIPLISSAVKSVCNFFKCFQHLMFRNNLFLQKTFSESKHTNLNKFKCSCSCRLLSSCLVSAKLYIAQNGCIIFVSFDSQQMFTDFFL